MNTLDPVRLADTFLCAVLRGNADALAIEPQGAHHRVRAEEAGQSSELGRLPGACGNAVVARLAVLAGCDPAAAEEQLGRVRVRAGALDSTVCVAIRHTPAGFAGELLRVGAAGGSLRLGGYELEQELGRGGMGVVFRARHAKLQKPVAVKLISEELASDRTIAARFVLEARAASRVRHPNIVDVTDFGVLEDGRSFLVMELVTAPTLETLLDGGAFAPARALRIATQIARALEAIHAAGIVHRDLKPANVFVDAKDRVKVGDFGAAKLVGGASARAGSLRDALVTQAGHLIGTPTYMAPEHARGLPVDARIDLYALGCVLFEMLSGAVPFDGATALDAMMAHILKPVPRLVSPHGPLPELVLDVVARALAKSPDDRYPSASEMVADLVRALKLLHTSKPGG